MGFPEPVLLPDAVYEARKARTKALVRIALIGISVRLAIVLLELVGYFLYGSMTLLLDSFSTLADVISSLVLVFSIKLAERPPDKEHPFGHGRYEPVAGLQLGVFLAIAGVGLFTQQLSSLLTKPSIPRIDQHVWLFAMASVVLLELSYRKLTKVAKEQKSQALLSEALHFRADSLNSLFALFILVLVALFPEASGVCDRVGAIMIALIMCVMGLYGAKKNLNQLLDRIPEEEFFAKVRRASLKVEGVKDTEKIRIQHYGPDAHVDIDIEVDPYLSVEVAHTISQHVRAAIQKEWPQVQDVTVHIEPYYENDHQPDKISCS